MRPVTLVEAFYKGLQMSLERFGEFLREVAVLVVVFIPLDLWKNEWTWARTIGVFFVSAVLFTFGLVSESMAIAVKRGRIRYEEVQANGSGARP